jgi:hypothetical protein
MSDRHVIAIARRKTSLLGTTAAIAVIIAGAIIAIASNAEAASTGIRNTRHNLSSSNNVAAAGGNTANKSTGTEVCVFCHTPHGASSTAAAPLWNKKLADPTSYTAYTSSTLDSTVDLTNSVSLACLTCHDGTQAMDTVLNSPGSGGYNATSASMGLSWSGSNVGNDGKLSTSSVTNLGTDLSNDHPVGIVCTNHESKSPSASEAAGTDGAEPVVRETVAEDVIVGAELTKPIENEPETGAAIPSETVADN